MTMMKTLPLQECKAMTLLLHESLYPSQPVTMTMTQMQNLITTPLPPMRPTTIQAKHLYTAPEATYQFTI